TSSCRSRASVAIAEATVRRLVDIRRAPASSLVGWSNGSGGESHSRRLRKPNRGIWMPLRVLMASASLAAVLVSSGAFAQAPGTSAAQQPPAAQASRITTYDAAFFAKYAPRTAYDIVQRIPGFTLDLGSNQNGNDVRGFAGTAGNVVTNGQRPSTKSEPLDAFLSRIPASRVKRVEVGAGDLYGADYSSKTQVANLILTEGGGGDA